MNPAIVLLVVAQVATSTPTWEEAWRVEREARIHFQTASEVRQKWLEEKSLRMREQTAEIQLLEGIIAEGQKKPAPVPEVVPWYGWTLIGVAVVAGFAAGFGVGLAQ